MSERTYDFRQGDVVYDHTEFASHVTAPRMVVASAQIELLDGQPAVRVTSGTARYVYFCDRLTLLERGGQRYDFRRGDIVEDRSDPERREGIILRDGSWQIANGQRLAEVHFPSGSCSYFADRLAVVRRAVPVERIARLRAFARAYQDAESAREMRIYQASSWGQQLVDAWAAVRPGDLTDDDAQG